MVREEQNELRSVDLEKLMTKAEELFMEESGNKIKKEEVIAFRDERDEFFLDVFPQSRYARLYEERERLEEKPELKKVLDLLEKAGFDFGET